MFKPADFGNLISKFESAKTVAETWRLLLMHSRQQGFGYGVITELPGKHDSLYDIAFFAEVPDEWRRRYTQMSTIAEIRACCMQGCVIQSTLHFGWGWPDAVKKSGSDAAPLQASCRASAHRMLTMRFFPAPACGMVAVPRLRCGRDVPAMR